jgi:transposase
MSSSSPTPLPAELPGDLPKVHTHAAGIDIGASEHWVCVDPSLTAQPIRRFGAFTEDLRALTTWLVELQVQTVAMEATGVYWRELYLQLEEAGLQVSLVDPRQTRHPRGRKTDMQDCRWIWQLHAHGLLHAAFVPEAVVQRLRTYLRFRQGRVEQAGIALKECQRALSLMNLKLQHVLSSVGGVTGQKIIAAIVAGERDPHALARLRDYRCQADEATLVKALTGTWREEHLFLLTQAHADYQYHHAAIAACDRAIAALVAEMPSRGDDPDGTTRKRSTGKNEFHFDAQDAAYRLTGIDLPAIDGIGPTTAFQLLGEVGLDLRAWPTAKAFTCWLGLCPNPKRSGGKHLGNLPTAATRAARILRHAAMGLDGKKSALAHFFRRIAARKGRAQAITATAHKLARIIYALFRDRLRFDPAKLAPVLSPRAQQRLLQRLKERAQRLGFHLVPATPQGPA